MKTDLPAAAFPVRHHLPAAKTLFDVQHDD